MKRRSFISSSVIGALSLGVNGSVKAEKYKIEQQVSPIDFDSKAPKPVGSMPMGELGKTGIKVSKFGFGSHMREDIVKYEKEREWMIREAYDLGINFFDIYDLEQNCLQFEPMGRYLESVKNDVVISIYPSPAKGMTLEQEIERSLKLLRRDYVDLIRIQSYDHNNPKWGWWDTLFKFKEQGKIRAVGLPIHLRKDLDVPLKELPLDFVILPFNYFHNWTWAPQFQDKKIEKTVPDIRKKGIGVITMKPFASDWLIYPFKQLGQKIDKSVNVAKASLKYIINSDVKPDTTLGGMYYPYQLNENVDAFFNPEFTYPERKVLKEIRDKAKLVACNLLPEHYKFLDQWRPDTWDDRDLFNKV